MSKWFSKPKYSTVIGSAPARSTQVPAGLYFQCPECSTMIYRKEFEERLSVCPKCDFHARLTAGERIELLVDPGTFEADADSLSPVDFLRFSAKKKYAEQLRDSQEKTGLRDAIVTGRGELNGMSVSLAVMDFNFLGGSMGSVVGERIARAMERALREQIPMLTVTTTGGARMMESILSLMQMAKTSALCQRLHERGVPFISILTDPSTAGVMASFAALGDLVIAEPNCLVGFAGRRVIEQTVREHLPKDFQKAEFVQEHGFVDIVCARGKLRELLGNVLRLLWQKHRQLQQIVTVTSAQSAPLIAKQQAGA